MVRTLSLVFLFWGQCFLFAQDLSNELLYVRAYVEERFKQAKVEIFPFPHLMIDDILPKEFYQKLIEHWPNNTFVDLPVGWRKSLPIGNENEWKEKDGVAHEVWRQFAVHVVDDVIKKRIAEFFYPYVSYRFGKDISGPFASHCKDVKEHRLCQDYGNGIGPHVDQAYIFSSVILYFPHPDDYQHQDLGTCLYTHKNGRETVDYVPEDLNKVNLVKVIPYKPNSLCAVLQTPKSWHSAVVKNTYNRYERRLYLTLVFLSSDFMRNYYGDNYFYSLEPTLKGWLEGQPVY